MRLTQPEKQRLINHAAHIAEHADRAGDELLLARAETLQEKLGGAPRRRDPLSDFWGDVLRNTGRQFP